MKQPVSSLKIFLAFLRLGLTAFGGPAMVAYIRDLCVKKNNWVSPENFQEGVALVQAVPGATAMQAAAYAGLRAGGPPGALAAYTGFTLPTFFIMLALSAAYKTGQDVPAVISLFSGLQVIVIALVANAAINFFRKTVKSWQDIFLTSAGALYIIFSGSPVTVIICSLALGPLLYRQAGKNTKKTVKTEKITEKHKKIQQKFQQQTFHFGLGLTAVITVLLLLLAFFLPKQFSLAGLMMKIDLFAFGGGYASLPLMLHEIVEAHHLLDEKTLLDGIALGQVTPGPIVITATFVGFLLYGISGSIITTIAIFTPSFLIVLLITPWFDKIKTNPYFQHAMRGIICSFVGLLIAVTIRFSLAIHWQWLSIIICLAAFIALRCKIDILWVVLVGGLISTIFL